MKYKSISSLSIKKQESGIGMYFLFLCRMNNCIKIMVYNERRDMKTVKKQVKTFFNEQPVNWKMGMIYFLSKNTKLKDKM